MAKPDEEVALLSTNQLQNPCFRRFRSLCIVFGALLSVSLVVAAVLALDRSRSDQLARVFAINDEAGQAALNFIAVGDWGRRGLYNQTTIADQMGKIADKMDIKFVISTGDNFYEDGLTGVNDTAFEESFTNVYTAKSLQKPWHLALGNHDYHGDVLSQLDPILTSRDWRWNCIRDGQIRYELKPSTIHNIESKAATLELFFIDTTPFLNKYWNETEEEDPFDWREMLPRDEHLQQKLENLTTALKISTATWKIVVGHHTIRSYGKHGDSLELISHVLPILEANNVDIYLNGHDHCMEHIKRDDSPIHFVTSGGGSKAWKGISPAQNSNGLQYYFDGQGFVSVSVSQTRLRVIYHNIDGQQVHKLSLSKTSLLDS